MNIQVARGDEARKLMNDASFLSNWVQLYKECPWVTSFQCPAFVTVWFDCYRSQYEPMLLFLPERTALRGMLALAVSTDGTQLVNAGARQAEYHSWICLPDDSGRFPAAALESARQQCQNASLVFQYLPPGVPLGWVKNSKVGRLCSLSRHSRPLLQVEDGSAIAVSLKKKSNRSKVNRLKRIGPLEFRQITNSEEFSSVIDQIIDYYDFRQGAVHDVLPFQDDTYKRKFHLELLNSAGLLHVTVLKVENQIASALLGIPSGKELQLGIIAHNPHFSAYSPGKLHMLFLAQLMNKEGFEQLDLTPGGDPYKERFASAHDEVFSMVVHPTARQLFFEQAQQVALRLTRQALQCVGINSAALKKQIKRIKYDRSARQSSNEEVLFYRLRPQTLTDKERSGCSFRVDRNNLKHLLKYEPENSRPSRKSFLSSALKRLEMGLEVYTFCQENRLQYCVWLSKGLDKQGFGEDRWEYQVPNNSAYLFDFHYLSMAAEGTGIICFWEEILSNVADNLEPEFIFTSVTHGDVPAQQAIEKLGFSRVSSEL